MGYQCTHLEPSTPCEVWAARYEQLRKGWFAKELGWEQTLFIRQGMAAWMKAWSTATRSESVTPTDTTTPDGASSLARVIRGEQQRQLTRILVTLVLHCQQEVLA